MRIFERSIAGLPAQPSIDNPTTSQDDIGSDVSLLAGTEEVSVTSGPVSRCNSTAGRVQKRGSETLASDGICSDRRNYSIVAEKDRHCNDTTLNTSDTVQTRDETCDRCGWPQTRESDESQQHRYHQVDAKRNRLDSVSSSKNSAARHRCSNNDSDTNFYKTYLKRKLRHRNEYYRACCSAHHLIPKRRKSYSTGCDNNKPEHIARSASRSNESLYCRTNNTSVAESATSDSDLVWLPRVGEEDSLHTVDYPASTGASPTSGSRISDRVRDEYTGDNSSTESSNSGEREKRIKRLQRQLNVLQQELLMLGGCDLGVTYC